MLFRKMIKWSLFLLLLLWVPTKAQSQYHVSAISEEYWESILQDKKLSQTKNSENDYYILVASIATSIMNKATDLKNKGQAEEGLGYGLVGLVLSWYATERNPIKNEVWQKNRDVLSGAISTYNKLGISRTAFRDSFINLNRKAKKLSLPVAMANFKLNIVDITNSPLPGVTVAYRESIGEEIISENSLLTDESGSFSVPVINYMPAECTKLNYKISKEGFYPREDTKSSCSFTRFGDRQEMLLLRSPTDYLAYFSVQFVSSNGNDELKNKLHNYVDFFAVKGKLLNTKLELNSIDLVPFKDKMLLQFRFEYLSALNTVKFNKYDAARHLFDEAVRKILHDLRDFIGDKEKFSSYNIVISSLMYNFVVPTQPRSRVRYEFMVPLGSLKQYTEKEITGQELLKSSIILMDGDRIDLKLD